MSTTEKALQIARDDGLTELISRGIHRSVRPIDPLYQLVKPAFNSYSVSGATAFFDMGTRSLRQHDFVDDLRSEEVLIAKVLDDVKPDDVFYDIGANAGIYTCLVGDELESGQVVAFEPHPEVFDLLTRNVAENDVSVKLQNVALSDQQGEVEMVSRGYTGHQMADDTDDATLRVETTRGDALVEDDEVPRPDICKIDIEGAEYLALSGLEQTLRSSDCRVVYCEIHTEKIAAIGGSPERVEALLKDLDFELDVLGERRDNYFVRATRSS
ncbi:FkbM family methyltransferase [Haloarchaeobius sp. FL176]|uniref:FkbM family methyltransferase n=1 Tax=Haloarchaeobius sp. FL176 TaxID=2967129 RepID=UPI0021472980|nr:FkbM family methyltransferase [Haloarchaeobius sp. FL176]